MGNFVRNLGAFSGGAATGFLGGRDDMRQQAASDQKSQVFNAEQSAWKQLGELLDKYGQSEPGAQIGNRSPGREALAAVPMLTQPAGNAPGPEAMQPAEPTPFVTSQPKRIPRTLPFAYDNLGS